MAYIIFNIGACPCRCLGNPWWKKSSCYFCNVESFLLVMPCVISSHPEYLYLDVSSRSDQCAQVEVWQRSLFCCSRSTQGMTWIIIPILQGYSDAGNFTFFGRYVNPFFWEYRKRMLLIWTGVMLILNLLMKFKHRESFQHLTAHSTSISGHSLHCSVFYLQS